MIAIEIQAAISPYSIAVAPDWSFRKRAKSWLIGIPQPKEGWRMTRADCSPVKSITKKQMKTPKLVSRGHEHKMQYTQEKRPVRSGGIGQGFVVRDVPMAERRAGKLATLAPRCLFAV